MNPPDGATPLKWLLLTNVEVVDFADAIERINWYRQRWPVEVYSKSSNPARRLKKFAFKQGKTATIYRLAECDCLATLLANTLQPAQTGNGLHTGANRNGG